MKKVWQLVTLVSFEVQEHILPFWKPPIKICLEPDCQVGSSVLKVRQTLLKDWGPTIWVWSQMSTAVGIYVNVYQIWKTSRVFKFSSLVTVKPLTKSWIWILGRSYYLVHSLELMGVNFYCDYSYEQCFLF